MCAHPSVIYLNRLGSKLFDRACMWHQIHFCRWVTNLLLIGPFKHKLHWHKWMHICVRFVIFSVVVITWSTLFVITCMVSNSSEIVWYRTCSVAVVSMTIRPQAPPVMLHTSTSMPESVGRPPRPWVKVPSSTVNGLRYMSLLQTAAYLLYLDYCFLM